MAKINKDIPQLDYFQIYKLCIKKGYWFPVSGRPFDLFVFGVRSNNREQSKDGFDDVIGIAYQDLKGEKCVAYFSATTDPSVRELINPSFYEAQLYGTAIMKEGQYRGAYKLGLHGGGVWQHVALIQQMPIKIYRDKDKDTILDFDVPVTQGLYGINIHAASLWQDLDKIDGYSAGCQVFANSKEYYKAVELWQAQMRYGLGDIFSYTLFTQDEFSMALS